MSSIERRELKEGGAPSGEGRERRGTSKSKVCLETAQ